MKPNKGSPVFLNRIRERKIPTGSSAIDIVPFARIARRNLDRIARANRECERQRSDRAQRYQQTLTLFGQAIRNMGDAINLIHNLDANGSRARQAGESLKKTMEKMKKQPAGDGLSRVRVIRLKE